MKKTILIAFLSFVTLHVNAQSFYKGALVTDLNVGFDAYRIQQHSVDKNTNKATDTTNGAAAKNISIGAEYGLHKLFGLGLRVKYDSYVTEKDSASGFTPTARGMEVGLLANFHLLRKEHFNLSLGIDMGYSGFLYDLNDGRNTQIYGKGLWTNFHITPRYYFGKFGLSAALYFPGLRYPDLTSNDENFNKSTSIAWKARGVGFNLGVQYRFFKE